MIAKGELIGRVARAESHDNFYKFTIATALYGKRKGESCFWNVTAFGENGKRMLQYAPVGSLVYVNGQMDLTKGKNDVFYWNMIVGEFRVLSSKQENEAMKAGETSKTPF